MPFVRLKMNIKKLVICLVSCLLLVGCTHEKEAVQQVVESYYEIVSTGDMEKANTMYASSAIGLDEDFQKQMEAIFQKDSQAFVKKVISSMYQEVDIESIQIQGKKASVQVKVTGILPDSLDSIDEAAMEQIENLVDAYLAEHEGRMTVLMMKDPQLATEKMMDDLSEDVFEIYNHLIDGLDVSTSNLTVQLEKVEDEWKIVESN